MSKYYLMLFASFVIPGARSTTTTTKATRTEVCQKRIHPVNTIIVPKRPKWMLKNEVATRLASPPYTHKAVCCDVAIHCQKSPSESE